MENTHETGTRAINIQFKMQRRLAKCYKHTHLREGDWIEVYSKE